MNELNRQFVDVLFDEGIVTRLIELAISEDPSDNESFTVGLNDGTNPLRNAKEEASYAVVSTVIFARPGKLMHKLVHVGARDAVCQAARTSNENKIFMALESASQLNFQQKERDKSSALKDPENIIFYVALCNATENFCSHYDCVGSPHDGKEIIIDKKYVEEDLSCEGVDKDTCIKRAAQNQAQAEASSDDEDDQMKTFIVDEWYRVPGKLDKWKYGVNVLGLFAAYIRSEKNGAPIIGSQDPNSPLKLQKVFDMLGRDDCCDISEDMLDQLYHRKDVVRYIVDTLYDDNPNFLAEMKEKEDERIRLGQKATYFVYVLLTAVVILLYKSWQNKKKMDAEKKMREEAEAVARKERDKKKSKKKKRQ